MTLSSAIGVQERMDAERDKTVRRMPRPKKTTLTDAVRRVFCYQQKNNGQFAAFAIGHDLSICRTDGKRYQALSMLYPDCLIGVYDKTVQVQDLIEDMQFFFTDKDAS